MGTTGRSHSLIAGEVLRRCGHCEQRSMEETTLPYHFIEEGGEPYLIRNVPAHICRNCSSTRFNDSTLERIDTLITTGESDHTIAVKTYRYPRGAEAQIPPPVIA